MQVYDTRHNVSSIVEVEPRVLSHIMIDKPISMRDNPLVALSRLKEHRQRRELTQIELAKISDVGRATIAAIETGKRQRVHPSTRARLARALKVKAHDLDRKEESGTHRKA